MAMNLIPGVDVITAPISAAFGIAKTVVGDDIYEDVRKQITWTHATVIGFVPYDFRMWIVQIPLFIIVILILIFIFGVSWGKAIFASYILQAVVITFLAEFITDKTLRWGFGI
jgi:hypothetical protein